MKIIILPNKCVFTKFFSYLEPQEKEDIFYRAELKKCLIVGVYDDHEKLLLMSVIDFDVPDYMHVREVCGQDLLRAIRPLEIFVTAFAKINNRTKISFCSAIDGIKWVGERMGFVENDHNEFVKDVK